MALHLLRYEWYCFAWELSRLGWTQCWCSECEYNVCTNTTLPWHVRTMADRRVRVHKHTNISCSIMYTPNLHIRLWPFISFCISFVVVFSLLVFFFFYFEYYLHKTHLIQFILIEFFFGRNREFRLTWNVIQVNNSAFVCNCWFRLCVRLPELTSLCPTR